MQKKICEKRIAENLLNFVKDINLQIAEAQGTPNGGRGNPHREIHAKTHHDQTARNSRQKCSIKAVKAQWHFLWGTIFQWLWISHRKSWKQKEVTWPFFTKDYQSRILYSAKIILKNERKLEVFSEERTPREFLTSRLTKTETKPKTPSKRNFGQKGNDIEWKFVISGMKKGPQNMSDVKVNIVDYLSLVL